MSHLDKANELYREAIDFANTCPKRVIQADSDRLYKGVLRDIMGEVADQLILHAKARIDRVISEESRHTVLENKEQMATIDKYVEIIEQPPIWACYGPYKKDDGNWELVGEGPHSSQFADSVTLVVPEFNPDIGEVVSVRPIKIRQKWYWQAKVKNEI